MKYSLYNDIDKELDNLKNIEIHSERDFEGIFIKSALNRKASGRNGAISLIYSAIAFLAVCSAFSSITFFKEEASANHYNDNRSSYLYSLAESYSYTKYLN